MCILLVTATFFRGALNANTLLQTSIIDNIVIVSRGWMTNRDPFYVSKDLERRIFSTEMPNRVILILYLPDALSSMVLIKFRYIHNQTFIHTYIYIRAQQRKRVHRCIWCIPYFSDPAIVENREWQTHPRHQNLFRFPENISHPYFRGKRLINLGPGTLSKQVRYRDIIYKLREKERKRRYI